MAPSSVEILAHPETALLITGSSSEFAFGPFQEAMETFLCGIVDTRVALIRVLGDRTQVLSVVLVLRFADPPWSTVGVGP